MLMSSFVSVCLMLVPMLGVKQRPGTEKVYQIELRCYQAEMQGNVKKETKMLTSPTLTALSGRQARFIVGGENPIPHTNPLEYEPNGMIVSMTMTALEGKSCIINLNAEESNAQVRTDELLVQSGNQVKVRGKIELNKKMSVRLTGGDEGKQTWLDFTITEHKQ
ncbi:MAG TPA: hypothetical protein PLN21_21425 [Gemmatales bacterium]|nr:hypothetical protein [Gemmatales bacterium]